MANQSSLQQQFLIELLKQRRTVSIFLTNGIKLIGVVVNFDDEVIVLKDSQSQLVYQQAISSILPMVENNLPREKMTKMTKMIKQVKKYKSQTVAAKQTN